MCKKVKIVNKSSRELPEEAVDAISFKTLTLIFKLTKNPNATVRAKITLLV